MLVIFDLDDTLVDTSGCLAPEQRRRAFHAMEQRGLSLQAPEQGLELLGKLDEQALSFRYAVREFVSQIGADPALAEIGAREFYENIPSDFFLDPLEGAVPLLQQLSREHCLCLVTVGLPQQQRRKLEKAGIDSTFFSRIVVALEPDKGVHYETLLEELKFAPAEALVCGDRVGVDLLPAKKLGMTTVLMRWGRGLRPHTEEVDYEISHLSDLGKIIRRSVDDNK